jgi:hypothetical protein
VAATQPTEAGARERADTSACPLDDLPQRPRLRPVSKARTHALLLRAI